MPELRDYQRVAVAHLHGQPRAGLMLDMGLGKTAVCLTALTPDHLPALVIAPRRVVTETWPAEAELWRPDLRVTAVTPGISPKEREAAVLARSDVTVVSQDVITDEFLKHRDWKTVIIDESSGYKAVKSKRWRAARLLTAVMPNVWLLTGTPAPNGLIDLWAQIYLLDHGKRLGKTKTEFLARHCELYHIMDNGHRLYRIRDGQDKVIHEAIEDICLSMESEGRVEIPEVTYNTIEVDLPPAIKRAYKKLHDDFVVDLKDLGLWGEVHTADSAGVLSNRLSQLTSGFLYADERLGEEHDWLHNVKLDAMQEVIDGTGSPVMAMYRFRPELYQLQKRFPDARLADEPDLVKKWTRGEIPVLVTHPKSVGHGLNMQHGGHTQAWSSLPWSLELWDQTNKRLARSGQQHPVIIHTVEARGTLDARVRTALRNKTSVQQALLDHLESPI